MKRALAALAFFTLAAAATAHAQNTPAPDAATDEVRKPSRDFIMLQIGYDSWNNKPDSIELTGLGRGIGGYICYDFPIQKSNFSFAAGIGIGTHTVFLKDQEMLFTDTLSRVQFVPEREDLKRFKFSTTYLEAPFELRYFGNKNNRNKGFKAAIGLRVGTLVGAHTKARRSVGGTKVIDKVNTRRYLETWRYGATVRVGWGNFSLFGAYQFSSVFKENQGPQVTPYSVGLCITGL